jgi:predicted alpha/beta hydrolase family esterase
MKTEHHSRGNDAAATVLIVPGLRDHVPEHWQTLLQAKLSKAVLMPPLERGRLICDAQVEAFQAVLSRIEGPVLLVAHSGGVITVAHWAQRYSRPIHGALLAAPPDFESPLPLGYPTQSTLAENGWLPLPRVRLPFRSIVAASENDPLGRKDRVLELARAWGSEVEEVGAVGHLNPTSGFGPWPRAEELIRKLL